ncbi:MAG: YidC/Oxa1 family membrane protein insertase [Rudaea sp.]
MRYLSGHFGISEAMAIILLTLVARTAMAPLSLAAAYQAQKNRVAIARIQPALLQLRERFKENPQELAARTLALHRESGIRFFGKLPLCNIGAQSAFGLGLYQALRRLALHSKFLWIANLAKPDMLLAILAGCLMCASMLLMPGNENHAFMALMVVPVVISVISLALAPSALGIYWATSNLFSAVHGLVLRGLVHKYPPQNAT